MRYAGTPARRCLWLAVGKERWLSTAPRGADGQDVTVDGRRWSLDGLRERRAGERVRAEGSGIAHEVDLIAHAGDGAVEGGRLTAPMPGKVIAFLARPGEVVKRPAAGRDGGDEDGHTITAPRDGKVEELLYAAGDQVNEGGELLRLAAV